MLAELHQFDCGLRFLLDKSVHICREMHLAEEVHADAARNSRDSGTRIANQTFSFTVVTRRGNCSLLSNIADELLSVASQIHFYILISEIWDGRKDIDQGHILPRIIVVCRPQKSLGHM